MILQWRKEPTAAVTSLSRRAGRDPVSGRNFWPWRSCDEHPWDGETEHPCTEAIGQDRHLGEFSTWFCSQTGSKVIC